MTQYPGQIDNEATLPSFDKKNINLVDALNNVRSAIINIEKTLGRKPGGDYETVRERLIYLEKSIPKNLSNNFNVDNCLLVMPNGDDTAGIVGDLSKPFKTISGALRAVRRNGCCIMVAPGTYVESSPVEIDFSVSIIGLNKVFPLAYTKYIDNLKFSGNDFPINYPVPLNGPIGSIDINNTLITRGPTGATGMTGATGPTGATGATGTNFLSGPAIIFMDLTLNAYDKYLILSNVVFNPITLKDEKVIKGARAGEVNNLFAALQETNIEEMQMVKGLGTFIYDNSYVGFSLLSNGCNTFLLNGTACSYLIQGTPRLYEMNSELNNNQSKSAIFDVPISYSFGLVLTRGPVYIENTFIGSSLVEMGSETSVNYCNYLANILYYINPKFNPIQKDNYLYPGDMVEVYKGLYYTTMFNSNSKFNYLNIDLNLGNADLSNSSVGMLTLRNSRRFKPRPIDIIDTSTEATSDNSIATNISFTTSLEEAGIGVDIGYWFGQPIVYAKNINLINRLNYIRDINFIENGRINILDNVILDTRNNLNGNVNLSGSQSTWLRDESFVHMYGTIPASSGKSQGTSYLSYEFMNDTINLSNDEACSIQINCIGKSFSHHNQSLTYLIASSDNGLISCSSNSIIGSKLFELAFSFDGSNNLQIQVYNNVEETLNISAKLVVNKISNQKFKYVK